MSSVASADIRYSVTDLGQSTVAYGINGRGDVAGSLVSSGGRERAAYYTDGSWHSIDLRAAMLPFEGEPLRTVAMSINDEREVVGTWLAFVNPLLTAAPFITNEGQGGFYFDGTTAVSLGADVLSATGINNAGQIVGTVVSSNGTASAFRYSGGSVQRLGPIAGDLNSWGYAIDDSGNVVGVSSTGSLSVGRPFLRAGGPPQPLLGFSSANGKALAINDFRDVVGSFVDNNVTRAFVHLGQETTIIEVPDAVRTEALSINRFGHVVGRSEGTEGNSGFLYKNGSVISLDSLLVEAPDVHIDAGVAINDAGQIAANGTINGRPHSLLLSPVEQTTASRLYVIAVGSKDSNRFSLKATDGQTDALAIEGKLRQFGGFAGSRIVLYDYNTNKDGTAIRTAISSIEGEIRPNDTVVFYYGGHGLGGVNASEIIVPGENAFVTDGQLTQWFDSDKWSSTNKLFIFDSCFSGGFAGGSDSDLLPDLDSLPRTAILAAAGETELSGSAPLLSENPGRGLFTLQLEDALSMVDGFAKADRDRDGLSFADLESFLDEHVAAIGSYQGFIRDDQYEDDDGTTTFSPVLFSYRTPDFEVVIPEPSSIATALLSSGLLSATRWTRYRGEHRAPTGRGVRPWARRHAIPPVGSTATS